VPAAKTTTLLLAAMLLGGVAPLAAHTRTNENSRLGFNASEISLRQEIERSSSLNALGIDAGLRQTCIRSRSTSKERDAETGLDYFGARYMASTQGRFTSPDAPLIDQHTNDPQSWNLYAYVRNNPLKFIDPNGLDCVYSNSNGDGVGLIDRHTDSKVCGSHGGTWVPGTVKDGDAIYNPDTAMFQVASKDDKNVYYSNYRPGAITNESGKCVSGNCKGADIQHADQAWLSSMIVGSNLDQAMTFMANRVEPLGGGVVNQIGSGPLAFWNNHWAGPGGMGPPHGKGDWSAMIHDFNFSTNGITIGSYFDPHISPATAKALIQSNNILMRNAGGVEGAKMGMVFGVVNAFQFYVQSWK